MACDIPLESSRRELQRCFRFHFNPRSFRKVMGLQSRGSFNLGYNLAWDRISIRGLFAKLWGSKSHGSLNLGDFGTPTLESWDKNHLDVGPVERCKIYYKGEGGGFPQVRAVVSLVCSCCPWLVLAPKHTNHLVWVLCRPVGVSGAYQLFLVPSRNSSTPFYPSKCSELRSVPRLFLLPLFFIWTHIWVFQGVGSASLRARSQLSALKRVEGRVEGPG
jgi:hypothetical protein